MTAMVVRATRRRRWGVVGAGIAGVLVLGTVWQLVGSGQLLGSAVPSIPAVVAKASDPRTLAQVGTAVAATIPRAGLALLIGTAAALVVSVIPVLIHQSQAAVNRVASLLNALPVIVMAPVLVTLIGVQSVPTFLGSLGVFFAVFVTVSSALADPPRTASDYFSTTGSSRWTRFRLLQAPAALPAFFDGLKVGAAAALTGVLFGEWFGSSQGLGVLLVATMHGFQTELMWCAAIVVTALVTAAYLVFAAIGAAVSARFAA